MIQTNDLTKRFGNVLAVDNLNIEVKDGEIYGLLGPNGSGKSTTMKILSGILSPSRGKAYVDGINVEWDPNEVKKIVGYIPEDQILYESLTPNELFNFLGGLRGVPAHKMDKRVNYFLKAFEFNRYLHQYIGTLSFGNKQKVAITAALIHDPPVLIMDEAMNGLDPKTARILREILFRYKERGKSIIFSTHVLPLAEIVCDRVGIINEGRIIAEGTVGELKEKAQEANIEDVFLELTRSKDQVSSVVSALQEAE